MTANKLLMQLQADLAGINIVKPEMAESTALGAAMLAGAAVDRWDIAGSELKIPSKIWKPKMSESERNIKYAKWKMAVDRSMDWDLE